MIASGSNGPTKEGIADAGTFRFSHQLPVPFDCPEYSRTGTHSESADSSERNACLRCTWDPTSGEVDERNELDRTGARCHACGLVKNRVARSATVIRQQAHAGTVPPSNSIAAVLLVYS